jgi:molybdopterin synthase catalytic subunit
MAYLTFDPIDLSELVQRVAAAERGAITTFLGTVRDHHAGRRVIQLQYEAFGPMAEAECHRIVAEAQTRWTSQVALQHRLGLLQVGDVAVAIAAASGHRDDAFHACRYVIEQVKQRVPIWKRERYADGSEAWVDPTAPGGTVPALVTEPLK